MSILPLTDSYLSHPSPLVIPTNGRDMQCALRFSQILPVQPPAWLKLQQAPL